MEIKKTLKEVYDEFRDKGLISVYAWGSITTGEFVPGKSDIDTIGIITKQVDVEPINKILRLKYPLFKMNLIYKSELDRGKIKSRLAKLIPPKVLLLEFKNWKHICGKKFKLSDFKMRPASYEEAIQLENQKLDEYLPQFKKGDFSRAQYYCKTLLMLCSYRKALNKDTDQIIRKLSEVKKADYKKFKKYFEDFERFRNQ